jgi:hypothetical protein
VDLDRQVERDGTGSLSVVIALDLLDPSGPALAPSVTTIPPEGVS